MMRLLQNLESLLARQLIKAGMAIVPMISEERLLSLANSRIEDNIKWPGGRAFLRRTVTVGWKALEECSPNCRKRWVDTLLGNAVLKGIPRRKEFSQKHGFDPPYVMVISPSMRCNLRCYGCYAGSYTKEDELDYEVLNRVINQAKEMGTYFITISGGEPFIRGELLDLFAEQSDVFFQVYTNGTLIDEGVAKRLAELGNVFPAISVEGFEKETDERRGRGIYARILAAMDNLRREGVIFGFSTTVTRENNEFVLSDEFIDFYAEQGCFLGWYFNYIPIGSGPDLSLMPTPAQRNWRRERLEVIRERTPILLCDFWNDGPLVGGCIAGGRYLHINNKGDVEPCVFVHFAADNIKQRSLTQALHSPFFQAIRRRQPYSQNLLRPCMIIDHPYVLRDVVTEGGAQATHPGGENVVTELAEALDRYAEEYGDISDPVWLEQCEQAKVLV